MWLLLFGSIFILKLQAVNGKCDRTYTLDKENPIFVSSGAFIQNITICVQTAESSDVSLIFDSLRFCDHLQDAPKKCASDIGLLLNDSAVNLNGTENYVNGLSLPNCTYEARTIHIKSYTYERCRGRFVGNLFIAWNSTDPTYVNTFGFSIRVEPWFNEDYDYQIGMVTKEQGLSWEFRYSERPMWVLLPLEIDKVNKLTKLTSTDTTCAYDLFIGMPPTGDSANNEQTLLRHYSDADPFDPMSIGGGDQFDDLLDSFLYSLRLPAKCMPLLEIAASGEKSSGSRVNQTMSAGKWTFIATQAYMSPFDEMSTNFQVDRAFLSEDDPVDLVLEIMEYHSGNLVVKFLDRHEQSVMDDYCWSKPTNVPFNTTLVYGLPTKVAAVVTWTQGDEEATADAEPKGFLAKIHAKPATTPMPSTIPASNCPTTSSGRTTKATTVAETTTTEVTATTTITQTATNPVTSSGNRFIAALMFCYLVGVLLNFCNI